MYMIHACAYGMWINVKFRLRYAVSGVQYKKVDYICVQNTSDIYLRVKSLGKFKGKHFNDWVVMIAL